MVDRRRLDIPEAQFVFPGDEAFGQTVVDQEGLAAEQFRIRLLTQLRSQFLARDCVHHVEVEPHRVEAAGRPARQDNCRIQRVADAVFEMGAGVDIDMEQRMARAQFRQAREEPLASEQGQHAQVQPQDRKIVGLTLHRPRQGFQLGIDRFVESMAVVGQLHCLPRPREQLLAHEILEIPDTP